MWLGLHNVGLVGGVASILNGPRWIGTDQLPTKWLGLESVGLVGGVPSILNGPRWTAALQLPTASTVRRWNHQDPSASATLVAVVAVVSFVASGEVVELCDHSTE